MKDTAKTYTTQNRSRFSDKINPDIYVCPNYLLTSIKVQTYDELHILFSQLFMLAGQAVHGSPSVYGLRPFQFPGGP